MRSAVSPGEDPMGQRSKIFTMFLVPSIFLSSCVSGRMYLGNVQLEEIDEVRAQPTGLRAGIRGLDRLESNLYQSSLELEFERALHRSGIFSRVVRDDFHASDVDLVMRFEKADLSYRRNMNLAYLPLALATLTIYIWVGGPILTDTQYFDVNVHVEQPEGHEIFALRSQGNHDHWINLYSDEYGDDAPCSGPDAREVMADLIQQLREKIRSTASAAGAAR
jgi:hypothetical protein